MGVFKVLSSLGITAAAGDLLKPVLNSAVGAAAGAVISADRPITAITNQTNILSRMFIEEAAFAEEVVPNLSKCLHQWYVAQVLSALSLGQMTAAGVSVQKVLSAVQTGNQQSVERSIGKMIARKAIGLASFQAALTGTSGLESLAYANEHAESMLPDMLEADRRPLMDYDDAAGMEAIGNHGPLTRTQVQTNINDLKLKNDAKEQAQRARDLAEKDRVDLSKFNVKSINTSENKMGPIGELYEVTLANPSNPKSVMTVPVFIQMQPNVIPTIVAPRFIDRMIPASLWKRWTMMKSGELSFWKDFVFQVDMIKRKRDLLRDPAASTALKQFLGNIHSKTLWAATHTAADSSSNLANSVMVFTENSVDTAKRESGIDLHDNVDRQRYFSTTFTLCIVILDPIHQRCQIYFNGITGMIDASYADFRPKDKNFDPKGFVDAIAAFSSGNIARMR